MRPYSVLLYERLGGGCLDKPKYEFLLAMQQLLAKAAYPRRGTPEETMTLQQFADEAAALVDEYGMPKWAIKEPA
jgi:hypothetical protein